MKPTNTRKCIRQRIVTLADIERRYGGYGADIKDAYCATRHTGITGAYVLDVCVTSWHNNPRKGDRCPFLPEKEHAA